MTALLPSGWSLAKLAEIVAPEPNSLVDGPFGSKLKTSDYVASGVRVVRLGNIGVGQFIDDVRAYISQEKYDGLKKHSVFPGDLLIAALAEPVGRCAQVPESLGPAIVKADCIRFKIHPAVDARYVLSYLNSPQGRAKAEAVSHGVGRLRINLGEVRDLPLPLAPIPEQCRIVAKLESLSARTRRTREALGALQGLIEQFRQSILAAAFRGDLTAGWRQQHPDTEPASALLACIRLERRRLWEEAELAKMTRKGKARTDERWKERYVEPERVEDDSLPQLPDGWVWARLDELAALVDYGTSSPTDTQGEVAVLRMGNILAGELNLGDLRFLPRLHSGLDQLLLAPGDLLFNRTNSVDLVGKCAIYSGELEPCSFASYLIRVRTLGIPASWVAAYLNSPFGRRWAQENASQQVGQANISGSKLRALTLPLPPLAEIQRIGQVLDHARVKSAQWARHAAAALQCLQALDASLLAKAFRGQLVPQDPNDEPAAALLERLRAAKSPGANRGRRRRR